MKKKNLIIVIASLVVAVVIGILVNFETPEEIEEKMRLSSMVYAGDAEGLQQLFKAGANPNIKIKDKLSGKETSLLMAAHRWYSFRARALSLGTSGVFERLTVFEYLPEDKEKRNTMLSFFINSRLEKMENVIGAIESAGGKISSKEEKDVEKEGRLVYLYDMLELQEWELIASIVKGGEIDLSADSNGVNGFHVLAAATADASFIDASFVKALLNAGAKINGKTEKRKYSPLAVAIENKNARAVKLFLENGANPNDSIPFSGAFGDAGTKSLMDLAIDILDQSNTREAYRIVLLMAQATGTKLPGFF